MGEEIMGDRSEEGGRERKKRRRGIEGRRVLGKKGIEEYWEGRDWNIGKRRKKRRRNRTEEGRV